MYGSPVWRPLLQCEVSSIERVQRHITKYILQDYVSDYKDRLIRLKLLPLAMEFELQDILFLIKNLKFSPTNSFLFPHLVCDPPHSTN